jgi:mRNA interferase MazF
MEIHRGDIVDVDLGEGDETRGHEIYKQRPAVVIQNDIGNAESATTIIAPATSGQTGYPFQVNVTAEDSDFERDSVVMLDQIRTVDIAGRIEAVFGSLDAPTMSRIDRAIGVSLGVEP